MRSFLNKIAVSIVRLWNTQETLSLRNIRLSHLQYLFAFPLTMIFVNIQDCLLVSDINVYGLPAITVTFISFALGATVMFAFASVKNISFISRLSATMTVAGFLPWLFLPDGYPAFVCTIFFMAGVGGCLSCSGFSFVFVQNNAERFFGSVFMSLLISSIKINADFVLDHQFIGKSLIIILITGITVCMFAAKYKDYTAAENKETQRFDPSIWLALFIFFSYFAIRIMGFYIPELSPSSEQIWGALALIPALFCVIMQIAFKRSIWIMCNVFFILTIVCYVMDLVQFSEVAYFFSGAKVIGLFLAFYLIGCVSNKFCNFRMHKMLFIICMTVIGIIYVIPDFLIKTPLTYPVAITVSSVLFIVFLLLSPVFSQYLFCASWSEDFRKLHMSEVASRVEETDKLKDYRLTPREKAVCTLLLAGYSRKQIGAELKISYPTVGFHCTALYKKLSINSLSELFAMFGYKKTESDKELQPISSILADDQ